MTNKTDRAIERARQFLEHTGVFFRDDDDPERLQLNLNDTWGWACADGEDVPDEELPEVARLFRAYGRCGILYWVSERRGKLESEFCDINRFVEFVRREEEIIKEVPGSSKRAYMQCEYTIGIPTSRIVPPDSL